MSKAVLLSVQPKWCKKILSRKKLIEVRKTRPKIETPFKCFIYCTQNTPYNPSVTFHYDDPNGNFFYGGKHYSAFFTARVVAEFKCNCIETVKHTPEIAMPLFFPEISSSYWRFLADAQMSGTELIDYLGEKDGYGWHISDLVIYAKPKELSDFCSDSSVFMFDDEGNRVYTGLKRPPQSWCYVEELTSTIP